MLGWGKQRRKAIRQKWTDCRAFFTDTAKSSSERNWAILFPMSLMYLICLCVYLFAVCPQLDIPLQTFTMRLFTGVHAAFTLWVFLYRKKPPKVWAVDLAITLFAAHILGLSGFLGIAVFPAEASFLFPLFLILMTLIYTRRPIYPILEILIPSALYLLGCYLTKNTYAFFLDVISVSIAIAISGASLYSSVSYKLQAYRAQQSLQKMCALDPMTGVNNKPTFEFLVEEYLRSCPSGSHALAMCDFDDFKGINDRHGHRTGDEVLKAFAAKLRQQTDGNPDLIAGRFGGDEFVLFFKQYDTQQTVLNVLQRLNAVENFPFPVSCSIGVAFSRSGNAGFLQYFDAADQGLYKAKNMQSTRLCITDADALLTPQRSVS